MTLRVLISTINHKSREQGVLELIGLEKKQDWLEFRFDVGINIAYMRLDHFVGGGS
jgi:hypothetical protein